MLRSPSPQPRGHVVRTAVGWSASASTTSTGSPKCSTRPPNAIGAQREPRPAHEQPGDHVRRPVHPERDTRGGDGDGDRDRAAEQDRTGVPVSAPTQEERDTCPRRRGRHRVTRRERRPREPGQRLDGGSGPVDDPLDAVGEEELSADRDRDERRNRPTPIAQQLDARSRRARRPATYLVPPS